MHIIRQGKGRPVVVLEPGLGASSVGWARVRDGVAALTEVIAYDRPGLGASPAVVGERGLPALADDLAHVIMTGRIRGPAVVVGHSLGATVARQLAATRAELVSGLVLIDPIPEHWVLRHGLWARPLNQVNYRTLEALARLGLIDAMTSLPLLRGITRSSTSPLAAFTDTERHTLAEEVRRPLSHRSARQEFSGLLRSRADLRALSANPAVAVPLTVISGGHTHRLASPLRRAATAWHAQMVNASPDARHVVVPQGGHFIPRYQPDIVVSAVAGLLDTIRM
jgi:pimeloyl-ACP methyl ester carboxylesterase